MARTSKPKTTTDNVESAAANVIPSQTTQVPVNNLSSEKVVKAKTPKAAKTPKVETPVSNITLSDTLPLDETSNIVEADLEAPVAEQSIEFLAKLQQLGVLISSLKVEYRTLEKKWTRELKTAQKQCSKRKRKAGNRAPSGFVKPTRISDELAKFLDKPTGSEMARTDVTRDINKYIRTHSLQDKENGRKIIPDTKLATLLKLKKTDELTYFNLQRYMSPHFAKAVKDVVTTTTV
jgi:upstream activation factor subunit UAF30